MEKPMAKRKSSIWTWVGLGFLLGGAILVVSVLVPAFREARESAMETSCLSNVKSAATGFLLYSEEYDGRFPDGKDGWMNQALRFRGEVMDVRCPSVGTKDNGKYGYAVNPQALGIKSEQLAKPEEFALVFDSTLLGANAVSGLETLPRPGRHFGGNIIGFADGHYRRIRDSEPRPNENPVFKPKDSAEP